MPPGTEQPRDFLMRILIMFFISICLFHAFPAAASGETVRKMREAEAHFSRGEYLEALGDYQEVLEQVKAGEYKPKALIMSATIYGSFLKNQEAALHLYKQVRGRYPGSVYEADAIFHMAMIQYERAHYREASRLFGQYLEKFPKGNKREVAFFMRDASNTPPDEQERKARAPAAQGKLIRVLILQNASEARVSASSSLEIRSPAERKVLATSHTPREARIRFEDGIFKVDGKPFPLTELTIAPTDGSPFRINGTRYRGTLKLAATDKGRLNAVNLVDIEEYLYGVVSKEMPSNWPEEALKAQAVISRTFVRYQQEANIVRDYDISATTASQVYGGIAAETERTRRVVDATRGRILTFSGGPALTYFHANSGGMTEDPRHVWRVAIPYLQSISDEYSARAPEAAWTSFLSFQQIRNAMNRNGIKVGEIHEIEAASISPSGRITKLKIAHSEGTTVLGGNEFRTMTDPALIKSTLFKAERNSQGIRFEGRGSGHGVGLSQWGARIMAEGGSPYREILLHYYKGLDLN